MTMDHDPGGCRSSSGDKYLVDLPPPPPAGATSPPSVKEQRERVREAVDEGQTLRVGDVFFPTSLRWWQQWKMYVGYEERDASAEGNEDLHPGRINNCALALPRKESCKQYQHQHQQEVLELRKNLVQYKDFEYLPEAAYTLLKEWYGGGPDLPRTVRRVGLGGNAYNRVELYPCVVDIACGDSVFHCGMSRERVGGGGVGGRRLMFATETPAGEFVMEVCKAAGVEVEHAELYLVVLPEEEEEGGMMDEVVGVTMETGKSENPQQDQEGGGDSYMDLVTDASLVPLPLQSEQQQQQQQQQQPPIEVRKLKKEGFEADETVADLVYGQTGVRVFVEDRSWRFKLKVGDTVDAMDESYGWYDSEIVEVLEPEKIVSSSSSSSSSSSGKRVPRVKIHFRCWESRWDVVKEVTSELIQPLFTKAIDWRHFTQDMALELRCKDDQKWYKANVAQIDEVNRKVLVKHLPHENEGASVWEEFESEDIARLGVHIREVSSTGAGASHSGSSGNSSRGSSPFNPSSLNLSLSPSKSSSLSSFSIPSSTSASTVPAGGGAHLGLVLLLLVVVVSR